VNLARILIDFAGAYIEDFLILSGLGMITWATFRLNSIAGMYVLGFILVFIGLVLSRKFAKRG
jgi:hypothetical protein